MDKKKIIIAAVAVVAVIAIAISVFLVSKNTKSIYTISFNTDGGSEVVGQKVEEGETINKPADPTKDGYEFLGWYLNGTYFDFETDVESDLTLDAKWKEIVVEDNKDDNKVEEDKKDEDGDKEKEEVTKYTVKFDVDGKITKKTVEKNKKVTKPADPTKDGYKFLGWYLGSTKYNFSNKVTKNITLKAKWEKVEEKPTQPDTPSEPETPVEPEVKEYTVKFDVDGKVIETKTVKENDTVSKISDPKKDGYTFKGWLLNGKTFNFSTKITGDIILKADWKKNDVVDVLIVKDEGSSIGQYIIYVTLNGNKVAGTVDITNPKGKIATGVSVPATGLYRPEGTFSSVTNPKVK